MSGVAAEIVQLVDRHLDGPVTVSFGWWPAEAAMPRMGVACMYGVLRRAAADLLGGPVASLVGETGAGYFVDGGQVTVERPFFAIGADQPAELLETTEDGVAFSQGTTIIAVAVGTPWTAPTGAREE